METRTTQHRILTQLGSSQLPTKARVNRIWPVRRPLEAAAAASRVRGGMGAFLPVASREALPVKIKTMRVVHRSDNSFIPGTP